MLRMPSSSTSSIRATGSALAMMAEADSAAAAMEGKKTRTV